MGLARLTECKQIHEQPVLPYVLRVWRAEESGGREQVSIKKMQVEGPSVALEVEFGASCVLDRL